MSITLNSTFFGFPISDEEQGGSQGQGRSAHRWKFTCLWADYPAVLYKLMGGAAIVGGLPSFNPPYVHPSFPWLGVTNCTYKMRHGSAGLTSGSDGHAASAYCEITAEFTPMVIDGDIEFGEERVDYSYLQVPMPDAMFHWNQTSGTSTTQIPLLSAGCPAVVVPTANFQRTLLRQPFIPTVAILALLGNINNATFLGAAKGQLLYLGCASSRKFDLTGNRMWDLTHSMNFNKGGFDKAPVAQFGAQPANWQFIFDQNGNPPYPYGDFTTLGFST